MLFLANEPAKKAEINILTARDTTGPGYQAGYTMGSHIGGICKAAYEPTSLWFFLYFLFFVFAFVFFQEQSILDYIIKSCRKGFELQPWFLPSFPARIFSLRGFFGQVFPGLRLTAVVSVVSGSSALVVFSLFCFPVSYLMYLFGFSQLSSCSFT